MIAAPSLAARYFVQRYRAATLRGAVERAAAEECGELFTRSDFRGVPVDVEQLAGRRFVRIDATTEGGSCQEALLRPTRHGFVVRLRDASSRTRKRWSLAHEIGHTLFYRDDGSGPRHQIGVLAADEIDAEERICNLFAGALLMPSNWLKHEIATIPPAQPSAMLEWLDRAARRSGVSVPALAVRLQRVQPRMSPYFILYFRHKENYVTRADARLRVQTCCVLGQPGTFWIWRNRSAEGVNLRTVRTLFASWMEHLVGGREVEGGRYSWSPPKGLVRSNEGLPSLDESVNFSRRHGGRWKEEAVPMRVATALYAPTGGGVREAHVISVLSRVA